MSGFFNFNLINFLDFYFSFLFFVGTFRRFQQYHRIGQLAFAGPTRWPRLLNLLGDYRMLFLTWGTVLPALLALALMLLSRMRALPHTSRSDSSRLARSVPMSRP